MNKPFIIGVAGGSGSGKTFFLRCFLKHFSADEVCLVSQDDYYKPVPPDMTAEENKLFNFDLPDTIDHGHFEDDIYELLNWRSIQKKEYLFILHFRKIADQLNLKIFIEADDEIALQRRLKRDLLERGYSHDDVIYKWMNHVVPAYKEYLLPYKGECDQVITNNSHVADDIICVTEVISGELREKVLS
jgi:uridine kinase